MKRRVTILSPNAVFSFALAPQPFERRLRTAAWQNDSVLAVSPQISLNLVSGELLSAFGPVGSSSGAGMVWVASSTSPIGAFAPVTPILIPVEGIVIGANELLTITNTNATGSTTCAIVTEDDYPLDWPE